MLICRACLLLHTMIAASKNPDTSFFFTLSLFQLRCARYQEQGKYGISSFVSLNTLHLNLLSPSSLPSHSLTKGSINPREKMATGLQVFGQPASTDVARVLTCLFEKNLEFDLVRIDNFKRQHKLPEFIKLRVEFFDHFSLRFKSWMS